MTSFDLSERVAVVTGGAGGIGSHIALEYARAGAHVVVAGRTQESLDRIAGEIETLGQQSMAVAMDITIPEQVDQLIHRTVERFGRVDVMVNNAGGGSAMRKAEATPYDEWVRLVDFNLTGTFSCCISAGKQMIQQQSGKIINISSIAGTKGNPGMLHYSAAKAGVISLTNNLAFMWTRHNITVNCIAPGLIATEAMKSYPGVIPPITREDGSEVPRLERPPGPEDVAKMARFLASEAADMITGEVIPVRAWFKSDRFWQ